MPPQSHWKERAMTSSQAITDAWDVTKTILARLAEWVLFLCMIMNIIEILPGVVLPALVSNLVLCVQAVTLDVAGFGLASMADHARDTGDEAAARTGKRTSWLLISLMVVTLLLVSIGLLWPQTQPYTAPAEKVLILARVIMTVVYSHVVHSLRRSTHTPQAIPAAATLDYAEIARQLHAQFPQPVPAPQVDYQELIQQLVPRLATLLVDEQGIKAYLEATAATIRDGRGSTSGSHQWEPVAGSHPFNGDQSREPLTGSPSANGNSFRESLLGASGGSFLREPLARSSVTSGIHLPEPVSLPGAREPRYRQRAMLVLPSGETEAEESTVGRAAREHRLETAYQALVTAGGRVSGRALAEAAHVKRSIATDWLRSKIGASPGDEAPMAAAQ
jgi:hypothetical protein